MGTGKRADHGIAGSAHLHLAGHGGIDDHCPVRLHRPLGPAGRTRRVANGR